MSVDLSKIKPGDEVTVRAVVADCRDAENWGLHFEHIGGGARFFVHPAAISTHAPKPLAVGDRARSSVGQAYIVMAVDGPYVWVKQAEGDNYATYLASRLERGDD